MGLLTRDLIVLILIALIALLSFHWEASYSFQTMAKINIRTTNVETTFSNVPEPIVLDHDLDKKNEILLAFDTSVALFRYDKQAADMVEISRFNTVTQPLLMTYISPKAKKLVPSDMSHKSYLVVLTDVNYNLTCLEMPSFKLLWTVRIPGLAKHVKKFDDMALADHSMIADYTPLYKGDIGAIFLTLRFDNYVDVAKLQGNAEEVITDAQVDHEHEQVNQHDTQFNEADSAETKADERALELVTHVAFFAFDLTTGKRRWHHTARDDHSRQTLHDVDAEVDDDQESMSVKEHDFKRHIAERSMHFEELDWRLWKKDVILKSLPHQWHTLRHTSLSTSRFSTTKEQQNQRFRSDIPEDGYENPYKFMNTHYELEPTQKNVLLYEHAEGITVIHLYTGQILTRLPLPPYRTFADANGDLSINSMFIDETDHKLLITTIYQDEPEFRHQPVIQTPLPGPSNQFFTGIATIDDHIPQVTYAPILLVPASTKFAGPGSGADNQLGAAISKILPDINNDPIPEKSYYVLILDSNGILNCIRSDTGDKHWTIDTGAGWAKLQLTQSVISRDWPKLVNLYPPQKPKDLRSLSAHMMAFAVQAKSKNPSGVLVISPTALVLVSPDGAIQALHPTNLPSISKTTLPIVADFTNDGRNDVVLATNKAYHFFILSTGRSHVFPLLVAVYLIILAVIAMKRVHGAIGSPYLSQKYEHAHSIGKAL